MVEENHSFNRGPGVNTSHAQFSDDQEAQKVIVVVSMR